MCWWNFKTGSQSSVLTLDAPSLCTPTIPYSSIRPPIRLSHRRNGPWDRTTSSHVQTSNVSPHPHCLPSTLTLSSWCRADFQGTTWKWERITLPVLAAACFWACSDSIYGGGFFVKGGQINLWVVSFFGPLKTCDSWLLDRTVLPEIHSSRLDRPKFYQCFWCQEHWHCRVLTKMYYSHISGVCSLSILPHHWLSLESLQKSVAPWGWDCCSPPFLMIWVVFFCVTLWGVF